MSETEQWIRSEQGKVITLLPFIDSLLDVGIEAVRAPVVVPRHSNTSPSPTIPSFF